MAPARERTDPQHLPIVEGEKIVAEMAAHFAGEMTVGAVYETLHRIAGELSIQAGSRTGVPPQELRRRITELAHHFADARTAANDRQFPREG